jgi:hypothetical protein
VGAAFQRRTQTHKATHFKDLNMLTTKLLPTVTAQEIGVNQPYFDCFLKDKNLTVDWCGREAVGVKDSEGGKYTFHRDQLEWLATQHQTVGQEQLNARLV